MTIALTTIIGLIILYCVYNIGFRRGCFSILHLFELAEISKTEDTIHKLKEYQNRMKINE